MIAQYPSFTELNDKSLDDLRSIVSDYDPYSDFNIVSLYCWAGSDTVRLSMLDDNLVIRMQDYVTREEITTLLGAHNIDQALIMLLKDAPNLVLLPAVVIDAIQDKGRFAISEDPDNHDYIYSVADLATLPGGQYKKKRNKLSKLLEEHGAELSAETKPLSKSDEPIVLNLFDTWAECCGKTKPRVAAEREALERIWSIRGAEILITYVKYQNQIVGFSLNEVLNSKVAVCHFEKVLKPVENINTYLVNEVAKGLYDLGIRLVNWEQDLGIDGLRSSKLSYGPKMYLKKYSLSLAE